MQIILLEKVHNVGGLGDVVKVKDGYARNFLIPKGMAKRATPENLKLLEGKRAELEKAAAEKLAAAQALAEKLEGQTVRVVQKAGVDGRLFGSVGTIDIAEALGRMGTTIEKSQVRLPAGPLKTVGEHPVTIALHTDVLAHVKVTVAGETAQG
jgi:large subunit ribosomal protein L9